MEINHLLIYSNNLKYDKTLFEKNKQDTYLTNIIFNKNPVAYTDFGKMFSYKLCYTDFCG